jgi:predicted transcriptional regulator
MPSRHAIYSWHEHGHSDGHVKNFHLPLPEEVYAALREQADALSRPATVIAREAIEVWLRERQRASVREAIAEYAAKHAGTTSDLDPALEAASLQLWGKRRRKR